MPQTGLLIPGVLVVLVLIVIVRAYWPTKREP